jgi:prepilin-type N-terminal cleavage/methylation domain-containing protein
MKFFQKVKNGFSLIELLIVIAIFGVLSAIGLTNYQGFVEGIRKDQAISHAENIYRTLATYSNQENIKFSDCNEILTHDQMLSCLKSFYMENGPFVNLENPYNIGNNAVEARNIPEPHKVFHDIETPNSNRDCNITGDASGVNGMVIIANDTFVPSGQFNISIFVCLDMTVSQSDTGLHWKKIKETILWN